MLTTIKHHTINEAAARTRDLIAFFEFDAPTYGIDGQTAGDILNALNDIQETIKLVQQAQQQANP